MKTFIFLSAVFSALELIYFNTTSIINPYLQAVLLLQLMNTMVNILIAENIPVSQNRNSSLSDRMLLGKQSFQKQYEILSARIANSNTTLTPEQALEGTFKT